MNEFAYARNCWQTGKCDCPTLRNPDYEVTVFKDGRAIIKGTEDVGLARGVYSRYIGS